MLANLPDGYVEAMNWGMISYEVPLATYPGTYNKKPLMYAALASQKNHMALYLTSVYALPGAAEAFERECRATSKRYDVGKSCVRFRRLDDLPLDLVGRAISAAGVPSFIARAEEGGRRGSSPTAPSAPRRRRRPPARRGRRARAGPRAPAPRAPGRRRAAPRPRGASRR